MPPRSLEIWKFGGASLADAQAVRRAVRLIAAHRGALVIVASALAGVTDALLEGMRLASGGDPAAGPRTASAFRERHRRLAAQVLPRGPVRRGLVRAADAAAREYEELARAVTSLRELSPRVSDLLVARGERLAAAILAGALSAGGRSAAFVDAVDLVATDEHHGNAAPDLPATRRRVGRCVRPLLRSGRTPVVPGFLGAAPDGSVTTLGRGGSDLTATLLARSLGARRVVLWKDVPGILTADPRTVGDARLIPQLHHREAAEVAHYGAKVLHPRALIPIADTRIVLEARSFLAPERAGTEVSGRRTLAGYPVKAVATVDRQALVTVAGKGMLGVPGIAARTFAALHARGLSVSTIFQASSESSIGFTLPEAEAPRAVTALTRAFRDEIGSRLIDGVTSRSGVAVAAVVGDGMAGTPGIAGRLFTALSQGGVNVIAIAQGSSERNISFVIDGRDAGEAARRVHQAFQLAKIGGGRAPSAPSTDVVLLGYGRVGRALADQVAARRSHARIVALLDRSGFVFDPRGLARQRLRRLALGKDRGALLARLGGTPATAGQALATIADHAVSRPVLVDVTADETSDLLIQAIHLGFDVVLANKRPLAGGARSHQKLLAALATSGRRLRYEATVGAGLPIIDTYRKLVESGDRVLRIEGCVSGTLGYVLSSLGAGRPFSKALTEAMARGYTEPDPRDDLSGRDAARKGLILARLMGYGGGPAPAVDLVPASLRRIPLAAFLTRLPGLDAAWRARAARAARGGRVLRYLVTATRRGVRVRLAAVPADSPIGALSGTRNLVAFTTRRYRSEPLVVSGPGAGPDVTAAGILNDIQQLAGG